VTVPRLAVGATTGSGVGALDVALVRAHGSGRSMRAACVRSASYELGPMADELRALADGRPRSAREIASLALAFGELHADAVADLVRNDLDGVDLICVQGHAVCHEPPTGWGLVNPHPVAVRTGVRVVFDLHQSDLALGGAGGPLAPIAEPALFPDLPRPFAVVHLGGRARLARLTGEGAVGENLCACGSLLDGLSRELLNRTFDEGGELAKSGWSRDEIAEPLAELLEREASGETPGMVREELDGFVHAARGLGVPSEDVLASAARAVAWVVARSVRDMEMLVVTGGGAHNRALLEALSESAHATVVRSDELGVPADRHDACAVAVLGLLCADRVPITQPETTGRLASEVIAGAWVLP